MTAAEAGRSVDKPRVGLSATIRRYSGDLDRGVIYHVGPYQVAIVDGDGRQWVGQPTAIGPAAAELSPEQRAALARLNPDALPKQARQ